MQKTRNRTTPSTPWRIDSECLVGNVFWSSLAYLCPRTPCRA